MISRKSKKFGAIAMIAITSIFTISSAVAGCRLVYRSPPDSSGNYYEIWNCDGKIRHMDCRSVGICVNDQREEK
jgi:hypothetical protein